MSEGTFLRDTIVIQEGSLGVGLTSSPSYKLHVSGNSYIDATSGSPTLLLGRYSGHPSIKAGADDSGYLIMDSSGAGTGRAALNWYSSDHVILANGGGHVGIGTTNPSNYKLTVVGETHSTHFITGYDWTAKTGGLHIGNDGLTTGAVSFYNGSDSSANIYRDSNIFYVGVRGGQATQGLAIDASGKVGIGTSSPERKLHIYKGESGGATSNSDSSLVLENSSNTYVQFLTPATSESGLLFGDSDNDRGALTYSHNNDSMNFRVAANTRMFINSSGNVGIGTTGPTESLHLGSGSFRINSSGGIGADGGSVHVPVVGGGGYATTTSSVTGYLKITLPQSWTSTMMQFTVDVYEYNIGKAKSFTLAGYNYTGDGGRWINQSAYMVTDDDSAEYTIRFGHDGTKCAIYIDDGGGASSGWSYPQVRVRDFFAGYNNYDVNRWVDGWSVGFTTSLGTITRTSSCGGGGAVNGSGAANKVAFWTDANTLSNNTNFHWDNTNERLGIGTPSPDYKLDVEGNIRVYQDTSAVGDGVGLTVENDGTGDAVVQYLLTATRRWVTGIDNSDSDKFKIATNLDLGADTYLTIQTDGNVGIGTPDPGAKLHIKDSVNPPEIRFEDVSGITQTAKIVYDQTGQNSLVISTQYQSATDLNVIQFAPADSVAMTIRGGTGNLNGFVGIGSVSPSNPLHIRHSGNSSSQGLYIHNINNAGDAGIKFSDAATASQNGIFYYAHSDSHSNGTDNSFHFNSDQSTLAVIVDHTSGNSGYYIGESSPVVAIRGGGASFFNGGSVGIGTAAPGATLDVRGDVRLDSGGNTDRTIYFRNQNSSTTVGGAIKSDQYLSLWAGNGSGTPAQYLTIKPAGNVGIGTVNPSEKLHVNGNVKGDSFGTHENTTARIFSPQGAAFNGTSSSHTGYLILKFPDNGSAGYSNMMTGVIRVFDYDWGESFDVHFAGYWYSGNNWTRATGWIDSQGDQDRNFTIRFGRMTGSSGSDDRPFITIGESTSTWGYVKFSLISFTANHGGTNLENWNSGWETSVGTGLPGTSLTTRTNTQSNNWKRNGSKLYSNFGYVGIGTTDPDTYLHVSAASAPSNIYTKFQSTSGNIWSQWTGTGSSWQIGTTANGLEFYNDNNSAYRVAIQPDGNVGIGTRSPNRKLDISGATQTWATAPAIQFTSTTTANANVRNWWVGPADTNYGNFHIFPSATQGGNPGSSSEAGNGITIDYVGKVGLGITGPSERLEVIGTIKQKTGAGYSNYVQQSVSEAQLTFSTYSVNQTTYPSAIIFAPNGSEAARINNAGNVGIGTTSPNTYKLEVAGPIYSTQYYAANTASSYQKLSVYGDGSTYGIGMVSGITYGALNDWAMTFRFSNTSNRGFWWGDTGHTTATGAMSLTTHGYLTVANRIKVGGGESDTSGPSFPLEVVGATFLNSGASVWNKIGNNEIDFARETNFGYSSSYRILQLGTSGATRGISIGVDVSGNASGSFGGNEIVFPNDVELITPNAANNGYLGLIATDTANKVRIGNYRWNILNDTPGITIDTSASTNHVGIGTTAPGSTRLRVVNNGTGQEIFKADDGATAVIKAKVDGTVTFEKGNVGIGTTSPGCPLQIDGTDAQKIILSGATDPYIRFRTGSTNRTYIQWVENNVALTFVNQAGDNFDFLTHDAGGAISLRLKGNDNDVWGYVYAEEGSSAAHTVGFLDADGAWATRHIKDTSWEWRINNGTYMFLNSSGNLGLGTTSPSFNLHIENASDPTIRIKDTTNNSMLDLRAEDSSVLIRSTSNYPMRFDVNQTERMRIDTSGNLGIGTTSPSKKLHVEGDTLLNGTSSGTASSLSESATYYGLKVRGAASSGSLNFNSSNARYTLQALSTGDSAISLALNPFGGNVGIGTTSPYAKLQVNGTNQTFNAHFGQGQNNSSGHWGGISLGYSENNNNYRKVGIVAKAIGDNAARQELHFLVDSVSDAANATLTDSKMMIDISGNVGINTTDPDEKLHVVGNARIFSTGYPYIDLGITTSNYWRIINDNPNDALKIGKNGAADITITGGKVGIGTDSPSSKLHVQLTNQSAYSSSSSSTDHLQIRTQQNTGTGGAYATLRMLASSNNGTNNAVGMINLVSPTNGNNDSAFTFQLRDSSSVYAEKVRIQADGKVGIGTTSPSYELEVSTSSNSRIAATSVTNSVVNHLQADSSGAYVGPLSNHSLFIKTNNTTRVTVTSTGSVGIGITTPLTNSLMTVNGGLAVGNSTYGSDMNTGRGDFSVDCNGTPQIVWLGDYIQMGGTDQNWAMKASPGLIQTWSQNLQLVAGGTGTYRLYLGTSNNNVTATVYNSNFGLGTTSPTEKLHVVGNIAISSTSYKIGYRDTSDMDVYIQFDDNNPSYSIAGTTYSTGGGLKVVADKSTAADGNSFVTTEVLDVHGITAIDGEFSDDLEVNGSIGVGGNLTTSRVVTITNISSSERPAIKIVNPNFSSNTSSTGKTFYRWLPIDIDGTTRWIAIYS